LSEYTKLELLAGEYSDMYKDTYGFRPRGITAGWTEADYEREIDALIPILEASIAEEKERESAAVVCFEKRIVDTIAAGAENRAAAIRWIAAAENAYNGDTLDFEYLCFLVGVPYGYLKKEEVENV